MEVKFFCTQWGSKQLKFVDFVQQVKEAGYDGIEMSLPLDASEKEHILETIRANNLLHIGQHWETEDTDFSNHKNAYRERITNLASSKPVLINSQTGKDFFSFEQNAELIALANNIAVQHGVKLVHEIHRGKFSFAAHITAHFIKQMPDLRIGFDVSHWCAVAESYLHNQKENVDLAISRADHIHARVGFPEGPQVPDPRAPEWQEAVDIHMGWWGQVIDRNKNEGKEFFTITPEFGPYPYMPILPFTQQPVTSQWEVNVYMMNLLRERFSS